MAGPTLSLALAIVAAVTLTACGGASHPSGASQKNKLLALAQCMRAHGVTNFPDPTQGPGGVGMSVSATPGSSTITIDGISFAGPVFTSAEKACRLFGGTTGPAPISEHQKQQLIEFARCMRAHGVPSWADPTFPAGGGVEGGGPSNGSPRNSPAAQKAIKTCNRLTGL